MTPILMTEEYWADSQFSVVRYYGGMKFNNVDYIIVNKDGKDIFECSLEAEKAGRDKAIEPGEPCDLIDRRAQKEYRRLGRELFINELKQHPEMDVTQFIKHLKGIRCADCAHVTASKVFTGGSDYRCGCFKGSDKACKVKANAVCGNYQKRVNE